MDSRLFQGILINVLPLFKALKRGNLENKYPDEFKFMSHRYNHIYQSKQNADNECNYLLKMLINMITSPINNMTNLKLLRINR